MAGELPSAGVTPATAAAAAPARRSPRRLIDGADSITGFWRSRSTGVGNRRDCSRAGGLRWDLEQIRNRRHGLEIVPNGPIELFALSTDEGLDRGPRSIWQPIRVEQYGELLQLETSIW